MSTRATRSNPAGSRFKLNLQSPHGMFIALPLSAVLWLGVLAATGVIH